MLSEILQLTVDYRDLFQTEKKIIVVPSCETHKMTTFFTQYNFEYILWISSACNNRMFFSAWDKSRDPTVNWGTLDDM